MHASQLEELVIHQREFFAILEEFFSRAAGRSQSDFGSEDEIRQFFRQNALAIAKRSEEAFVWLEKELGSFYQRHRTRPFKLSSQLGGVKLVLGGSSAFLDTQLRAVRKTLLYADTILVPDPILSWLEAPRKAEGFRFPRIIQAAWAVLQLKPLVDASLQYPAIVVFPSWEKSLEEQDSTTREGIRRLVTDVVSRATGQQLETFEQVGQLAKRQGDEFLRAVEQHALFVPPEGAPGESISTALSKYREFVKTWREEKYAKELLALPDSALVLNGIVERVAPQFHLLENSQELNSDPLFCLPVHAHYWRICCALSSDRLQRLSLLDEGTFRVIEALNSTTFNWLGNVPINALVELRKNNENEDFRRQLNNDLQAFHRATVEDTNKVVAEVGRSIESLLTKHQQEISRIEKKYSKLHGGSAVMSWATAAGMYVPLLAPYLGVSAPLVLLMKYGWDKVNENEERKKAARSLMGVLAYARE